MPGIREAINAKPPTGGTRPLVDIHLAAMDTKLRRLATTLLASEHSDRFVADAFSDDGYPLTQGSVRTYRRANKLQRFA